MTTGQMHRNFLRFLLLFLLPLSVSAQTVWTGNGSDDDWFNGDNWAGGSPPASLSGQVIIDIDDPAVIDAGDALGGGSDAGSTIVGQVEQNAMLIIRNGGTLQSVASGIQINNQIGGVIGQSAGSSGSVMITGDGSEWTARKGALTPHAVIVGSAGHGTLTIADGGTMNATTSVQVAAQAGSVGTINIGDGGSAGIWLGATITGGAGDATLNFNHTDASYNFGTGITGAIDVNHIGSGTTTFTGNKTYTGATNVQAGTLVLNGNLTQSAVTVHDGAALAGQGAARSIGNSLTVLDGGRLAVGSSGAPTTMTIGDLTLSDSAILEYRLGAPGETPDVFGSGDTLIVTGDLVLDGELSVVNLGGEFDDGVYLLIDFSGGVLVADNGLVITGLPGGLNGSIEVDTVEGHVLLIVGDLIDVDEVWWDGQQTGGPNGGDGTWDASTPNWTDEDGTVSVVWQDTIGVFSGDAGTVQLTESVEFTALSFETDGYVVQSPNGSVLTPNGDELGASGAPEIEVVGSGTTTTLGVLIDSQDRVNGLRKTGAGTLVLTEDQTFTGLTTVASGRLQLGDGGTSGSLAGNVTLGSGTRLVFNRADQWTLSGSVTGGSGATIEQLGTGVTVLSGSSTGFNGTLLVTSGGVRIDQDGVVGTGDDTVAIVRNGSTIWVDGLLAGRLQVEDGAAQVAGAVTGNAVLDQGVLQIDGSVGGNVTVNAGALDVDGSVGGAITLQSGNLQLGGSAGSLALNGGQAVVGGTVAGAASVGDSAMLALSGRVGGNTTVAADGTLLLDGGEIGGNANVFGLFSGTGEVDGNLILRSGSRLAIDTVTAEVEVGPETLRVGGNVTFEPDSLFEVGVNRHGAADLLYVEGSASLGGGSVLAIEAGDGEGWDPQTVYTILFAEGGRSGTFADVDNTFAFLDAVLRYQPQSVTLQLTRNDQAFDALPGLSSNQRQVAGLAEALGFIDGTAVFEHPVPAAIMNMGEAEAAAAFDQLSGEAHAGARSVLLHDAAMLRDVVLAHAGSAANPGSRFWMRGLYHDGRFDADGAARVDRSTAGMMLGADYLLGSHGFTMGWGLGYHRSDVDVKGLAAEADVDNVHAAIYTGARWDDSALPFGLPGGGSIGTRLGVTHSWHEIDMQRTVGFVDESLRAEYDARSLQVFGEVDYRFDLGDARIAPFLGVSWTRLHVDGFDEVAPDTSPVLLGQTAALQGRSGTDSLAQMTLGSRGVLPLTTRLELSGMAGWRHIFSGDQPEANLRLRDADPDAAMIITGAPLARNALIADLGLRIRLGDNGSLGVSWAGQTGGDVTDNSLQARFEWLLD